jgi:hypothetical protein
MAYEPKELQGSLWRNEKKESDKHPDHTGSIMIGGVVYRLSAWINETKDGSKKYFNIKASPADEKPAPRVAGSAKTRVDLDDEVPF